MKKLLIALLCSLLLITSVSCENNHGDNKQPRPSQASLIPSETIANPSETKPLPTQTATLPPKTAETISPEVATTAPDVETTKPEALPPSSEIPTNTSVNVAWGEDMCEANGFVFYVSNVKGKENITRMEQDGSNPTTVTAGDYSCLGELTSDSDYLYFVSSTDTSDSIEMIYRIPLSGGKEQEITQGSFYELQSANGKLYWVENIFDNYNPVSSSIKCMNSDGSNMQSLWTIQQSKSDDACIELVVFQANIYYAVGITNSDCEVESDVFRMDLDGQNATKLNDKKLTEVDKLFYDQGCLYLLTEDDYNLVDSLQTIDSKGNVISLLDNVGYFPQDEGCWEYCGVSNHKFYHFSYSDSGRLDLRQFDLISRKDSIK